MTTNQFEPDFDLPSVYISDETVVAAAFGHLPPEQLAVLMDDEHLEDFQRAVKALQRDLSLQVAMFITRKQAGEEVDRSWYVRCLGVRRAVDRLSSRVGQAKMALQQRRHDERAERQVKAGDDYGHRLHLAIVRHREHVTAAYEATEADTELWQAIAERDVDREQSEALG